MVHVLVRHKVADYTRWKQTFDAHFPTRKRAGETGCHLFHNVDDPHDIFGKVRRRGGNFFLKLQSRMEFVVNPDNSGK